MLSWRFSPGAHQSPFGARRLQHSHECFLFLCAQGCLLINNRISMQNLIAHVLTHFAQPSPLILSHCTNHGTIRVRVSGEMQRKPGTTCAWFDFQGNEQWRGHLKNRIGNFTIELEIFPNKLEFFPIFVRIPTQVALETPRFQSNMCWNSNWIWKYFQIIWKNFQIGVFGDARLHYSLIFHFLLKIPYAHIEPQNIEGMMGSACHGNDLTCSGRKPPGQHLAG